MKKYDFSQDFHSKSLDTLITPCANNNRQDSCNQCDGMCLHQSQTQIGDQFQPYPINKRISIRLYSPKYQKYLSYDDHNIQVLLSPLYLANTDKVKDVIWNAEPGNRGTQIYTVKTPHLFLEVTKPTLYAPGVSRLGLSYFQGGREQEWQVLSGDGTNNQIILRHGTLYLNTDGRQVFLDKLPHIWQLTLLNKTAEYVPLEGNGIMCNNTGKQIFTSPYVSSASQNCMETYQSFPDNPTPTWNRWNKYYSQFWNGEYTYAKTNSTNGMYFVINLNNTGSGHMYTKDAVWVVQSISGDKLRGCNNDTEIYVEMLTSGQPGYNANLPQIRILFRNKHIQNAVWQSLSSDNPYNLRAYSIKVSDTPNMKHTVGYPNAQDLPKATECFDNPETVLAEKQILSLSPSASGYNSERVDLDRPPACVIEKPTKPIRHVGYGKIYPMDVIARTQSARVYYVYYTACGQSLPSPVSIINLTNETTRMANPIVECPLPVGQTVLGAVVYAQDKTGKWGEVGRIPFKNNAIRGTLRII